MIYRRDRYGRGGDHIPFLERGFTAVARDRVSTRTTRINIRTSRTEMAFFYGDTPEFVDFEYTANVARVNLIALGVARKTLRRARRMFDRDDTSDERHRIEMGCEYGRDLAGYEIVWRDTTAAEWTDSLRSGTSRTL
jgi:hypothetical protein